MSPGQQGAGAPALGPDPGAYLSWVHGAPQACSSARPQPAARPSAAGPFPGQAVGLPDAGAPLESTQAREQGAGASSREQDWGNGSGSISLVS